MGKKNCYYYKMMLRVDPIACAFLRMFFHFGICKVKVQIYSTKINGIHPMCQILGNSNFMTQFLVSRNSSPLVETKI